MKLSALRYYGGKSANANKGVCQWVSSQLYDTKQKTTYVEPFAGMLGVLLQRPKAAVELASDAHGEITNWWTMVRDRGPELKEKLYNTPYSQVDFPLAYEPTDDPLEQARRTTMKLVIGFTPSLEPTHGATGFNVRVRKGSGDHSFRKYADRIPALQDRIHGVAFLCQPAEKVMAKIVNESTAMTYCDPPYLKTDIRPYGELPFDRELFNELLLEQKGAVAISGYKDEWDHLGWVRNEFQTHLQTGNIPGKKPPFTEVLWTNYQPDNSQITMFDVLSPSEEPKGCPGQEPDTS